MTDHELQLLFIGIAVGMDLMLLVQVAFGFRDDRRDRKAARAAWAQLEATREKVRA
ncbi:hypothetical protein SCAB_48481 [Streptomyces scabiei 87.22]|uniref:Uncharacterized protein n=1 Tax=Streptomyces scabiei (strain 87.22) TaxID=680198 RepID=C9ZFB3_STRSW|nr:hypothetical protein [Streptomyces scabiei]MDX2891439.1 hypothetical protein [Streptomyces scabiei]MDX2906194.1 hypothetical protein [Streptomyces scabiei]MDX2994497.1 hypothetical protein [Streptomyces scabiei]MDX3084741.1 hypothetical protein [Streptomyces scabiei]MDX3137869.1 hypothetical protein [Streptomyces scabiei]